MSEVKKWFDALSAQRLTLVGYERFHNAGWSVLDSIARGIPGAIVECGTFKGGVLAHMAKRALESNPKRMIWGFDTFSGIPVPGSNDGRKAHGRGHKGDLCASQADVEKSFEIVGLKDYDDYLCLSKGLFQDTLPIEKSVIGPIAVLRLDGDWYDSTKVCLEELYDQVSPGGWVIIDDYGHWPGCKKAVDEFVASRGLNILPKMTDYTEYCWMKE